MNQWTQQELRHPAKTFLDLGIDGVPISVTTCIIAQLYMSNHLGYARMSILILIIINGNVCRIENLKTKIHQNRLLLKIT